MRSCHYAVADLLPHEPPLILLDRVRSCGDTSLQAEVDITDESLFIAAEGVPNYIGIEYMAQACAAYVGVLARDAGEPVKIGFLLGTRNYVAHLPWFRRGQTLTVNAVLIYRDMQMAAFACRIEVDTVLVSEAQLNVYLADADSRIGTERDRPG